MMSSAVTTHTNKNTLQRHDFQLITNWVEPQSKVLDLGCGDGSLLRHLQQLKSISGYGLELRQDMIARCIANGVNAIHTDLDKGLTQFDNDSFDMVILSLTLQSMKRPKELLREMLRVGKHGIVTFPNFAYWRNRLQLTFGGKMPISEGLPHKWYRTPNIHLCTLRDFNHLCDELNFYIEESVSLHSSGKMHIGQKLLPNLFGEIALCKFGKNES